MAMDNKLKQRSIALSDATTLGTEEALKRTNRLRLGNSLPILTRSQFIEEILCRYIEGSAQMAMIRTYAEAERGVNLVPFALSHKHGENREPPQAETGARISHERPEPKEADDNDTH